MFYDLTQDILLLILDYLVDLNFRYTLIGLGLIMIFVVFFFKVKEEYLLD